jgi:3-oxoacyl-[acyl-carrier protein] reductase
VTQREGRLKDRVAVVTGGSSGIGLGIVGRLLAEGAKVAFCGTSEQHVSMALAGFESVDGIMGSVVDVAEETAVVLWFDAVRARWGGTHILVNNAAVSPKKQSAEPWVVQLRAADWRRVLDVNLTGAWLCARAASSDMMARGWGRIVNIGSIAGRTTPRVSGPHYAATKAGLLGLTRALAQDLAAYGITVNCISPAWIVSGMTAPADSPMARDAAAKIPVGRVGQPGDVAAVVAFLAADEAGYITGVNIDLNGGAFTA